MKYQVITKDGRAKRARMETVHGTVETPVFMNVGTVGAIKGAVSTDDLREIGTQVELSNTYHLHVRTGDKLIREFGGLHRFMNWDRPILTDSGGFQVFSLATLRKIKEDRLVKNHGNFPVYVDSPLAVEATEIFEKNIYDCFDEEAMELVRKGINPISFPGLRLSITSDESKAINFDDTPKVIISASGMCEAGRIKHHLKHNLWREECTVLFVGYQSVGTLGRNILEGAQEVKLFGEAVDVRAEIRALQGMSGHADKNGLIAWLNCFEKKPERVFIVHGEDTVCTSFAECLRHEYGYHTYAPFSGTRFDLLHNLLEYEAAPIAREKKAKAAVANSVYARLEAAGQRLLAVIRNGKGMANKDMAKLADQINALCDKWQ